MEPSFYSGQLVWAKLRGFPWWPGIVSSKQIESIHYTEDDLDIISICVQFIGENSHSILPTKAVADYIECHSKYSKVKQKVKTKQLLLRCIKAADLIRDGRRDKSELREINDEIISNKLKKNKPKEKSLTNKIQELLSEVEGKDLSPNDILAKNQTQKTLSSISRMLKNLSAFVHINSPDSALKPDIEDLISAFSELIDVEPNVSLVESSNIFSVLKFFKEEFIDHQDLALQSLAKLAHKLYLNWKSIIIKQELSLYKVSIQ